MFPQITIKHNIGNTIEIPNQLDIRASTYLSANITAPVTTVTVDNASDFTSASLLLISSVGAENAEFVAASSHTTNSFTTAATTMLHTRGDIVQEVKYNQIAISKNGGAATVITMNVTQQSTIYYDTAGLTTDTYTVKWLSSLAPTVFSSTSAPISVLTYPLNSVANIIFPVLKAMGVSEDDPKITVPFCLSAIDDARKYTEAKLYGIRHAWQQEFEFPIKMYAGTNYCNLPDDVDFSETDQSVLAARFMIGNVLTPFNLKYIDKRSWNQIAFSVMGGYNQTLVAIGGGTITLDSVGDFPQVSSGVAYVATTDFTQTIMQIAYTSVDLTTNQLLGVTGVTRAIPAGTRIWSRPTISQPIYYTVFDDKLYFDRIIPDSMQGNNLYIDYYKKIEFVTDLYQVLPEHYREIYKWYLRYAIKYRKDISLPATDPDLKKFEDLVTALFNNLYTGQDTTIITS